MLRIFMLGSALTIYGAGLGLASYMTATGKGISVPKVQKKSVRARSVGHRRHHTGYRGGK